MQCQLEPEATEQIFDEEIHDTSIESDHSETESEFIEEAAIEEYGPKAGDDGAPII